MRNGDFAAAARGFSGALKDSKSTHSVQVLIACSSETVQKALKSVQAQELFIVPIRLQGKACYRLGWGVYESEAKATAAIGTVPSYFKDGNKPKALPLSEMLR
jgi:septal ring-binding cell division protein DamX